MIQLKDKLLSKIQEEYYGDVSASFEINGNFSTGFETVLIHHHPIIDVKRGGLSTIHYDANKFNFRRAVLSLSKDLELI